jgi:hypothetical protein
MRFPRRLKFRERREQVINPQREIRIERAGGVDLFLEPI